MRWAKCPPRGRAAGNPLRAALTEALKDADAQVVKGSVVALGRLKTADAGAALCRSARTRTLLCAGAIEAIGSLGPSTPAVIETLLLR
jgi:hypothetical protein